MMEPLTKKNIDRLEAYWGRRNAQGWFVICSFDNYVPRLLKMAREQLMSTDKIRYLEQLKNSQAKVFEEEIEQLESENARLKARIAKLETALETSTPWVRWNAKKCSAGRKMRLGVRWSGKINS